MKKFLLFISLIVISISAILLPACSGFFISSDEKQIDKNFRQLLTCMQSNEPDKVKALFAPNKIANIENFDESVDELFSYYNGEYTSYQSRSWNEGDSRDGKIFTKFYIFSYDVTTTECVYRIACEWYVIDTVDKDNVGIWAFDIIKYDDDPYTDYPYGGDGSRTAGINIGKVFDYGKKYFESTLYFIHERNKMYISDLFPTNKRGDENQLDENIDRLLSYYEGDLVSYERDDIDEYAYIDQDVIIRRYAVTCQVSTTSNNYRIAILWCGDDPDCQNVGLWSLYVIKADEYNSDEPYWGDGLWTNGINIGVTKE
jgi:hypothetical protein